MNRIILSGRLTKDIELKYTKYDNAIVSNGIAVQRPFKNADGMYETDFINIEVWGKKAEYLSNYAKKGDKILINGRLQTDSYEKEGKIIHIQKVVVEDLELISIVKKEESKKEVKEETQIETKKLADDVFEDFGNSINEDDVAF